MRLLVPTIVLAGLVAASDAAAYEAFGDGPVYAVDTGPGRATLEPGDRPLTATQFLAAQFTLDSDELVVSIEGWLAYLSLLGDLDVDVVVYGDAGEVPDTTDVLGMYPFSVPSVGFPYAGGWHGVYGIELELEAGTYWLSFELPSAGFGSGGMPPTPAQELDNYALGNPTVGFTGDDTLNLGVRIAVPEPGMGAGLAAGALGLALLHRRRAGRAK